ncbi:MAG: glycosyltransferase family 2 protein [Hyphomicrobiales bacterium]|nr:glycosyltransferase family 2 protein [Hyphomicrobiales bacterium]
MKDRISLVGKEAEKFPPHGPTTVTVAICTFRRPSVVQAVESAVGQRLPADLSLHVLVIDNDITPSAKPLIDQVRAKSSVEISYHHVPGQNISIARNAALEKCSTELLAFLDDDEYAPPDWLESLAAFRQGAQAVFGPSEALYPEGTPSWLRLGDFHSNRLDGHETIDTGYTSNVLIDMEFVRRHRLVFDPSLGESGGEDTMFFRALHRSGGTLRYAPKAVVHEKVVGSRLTLAWVRLRRYRAGQVYGLMLHRFDRGAYLRAVSTAPLKVLACVVMSAAALFRPGRAPWWLMRGVFHFGVLSFGLGAKLHREYQRSL